MRTKIAIALLLVLLVSGCGFQLRGQETAALTTAEPIHLTGITPHRPLYRALARALEQTGAKLSDQAAGALLLRVSDVRSNRRVLSVDRRNKTVEFELEESFLFSLRDARGAPVTADQRLRALRISLNPEIEVLGRSREEQLLRDDMREELAQQLVERIAAAL